MEEWYPEEVMVSSMSLNCNEIMSSDTFQRKATVEMFVLSLNRRLISVSGQWFSDFTTTVMGTIHDCYILAFDRKKQELIPFATYSESKGIDLDE